MENIDRFSKYYSGDLKQVEEELFFSELASNNSVRDEFKTFTMVNSSLSSIVSSYKPSEVSKSKLFAKAGFVYTPVDSALIAATASKNINFGKFASYTMGKLGFILFGLIIGAGLMFLLNDNSEIITAVKQSNNIDNRIIKFSEPEKATAVMSSISKDESPVRRIQKLEETAYINSNSQDIQAIENNESVSIYEQDIQIHNSQITQNLKVVEIARSSNISDFDKHNRGDYSNKLLDFKDLGLSIEVRSSSYWNMVNENVLPSEISKLHNLDIFAYKELIPNLLIGAGVRQETFYAKYHTVENGRDFIYEQQPNLTNIEVAVRYFPYNFGMLNPLIQVNFGGGNYGYTYRGAIGSEINLIENWSLILTFDYATFNFFHKDIKNNSSKIGLNYGINYKF